MTGQLEEPQDDVRRLLESEGLHELVLHALLAAATVNVPFPLLDAAAERAVRSSMFFRIGRSYDRSFGARELMVLSRWTPEEEKGGCCLLGVLLWPVNRLFAKLHNFRNQVDLATHTFVEGYIVLYVLDQGLWPERPGRVREVIDHVTEEAGTRPMRSIFRVVLQQAQASLRQVARLQFDRLRSLVFSNSRPEQKAVTQALDELHDQEEDILEPAVAATEKAIQEALDVGGGEYVERLHRLVREQLDTTPDPSL